MFLQARHTAYSPIRGTVCHLEIMKIFENPNRYQRPNAELDRILNPEPSDYEISDLPLHYVGYDQQCVILIAMDSPQNRGDSIRIALMYKLIYYTVDVQAD